MSILTELVVERLNPLHNTTTFNCEDKGLNNFLKKDALDHQRQRISFSTVYLHNGLIVGYVTLATDSITLELDDTVDDLDTRFPQIPALKVCRIARDLKFKGAGLGKLMLEDAFAFAHSLNRPDNVLGAGCRFVTVDVRNPSLVYDFYVPNGFELHAEKDHLIHLRYDLGCHEYEQAEQLDTAQP